VGVASVTDLTLTEQRILDKLRHLQKTYRQATLTIYVQANAVDLEWKARIRLDHKTLSSAIDD